MGDDLRRGASAAGKRHEYGRGLLDEVKGAREDIAALIDDEAGRGAGADEHFADTLQAADRLNLDDGRRDALDGRADGGFFLRGRVVLSAERIDEDGECEEKRGQETGDRRQQAYAPCAEY